MNVPAPSLSRPFRRLLSGLLLATAVVLSGCNQSATQRDQRISMTWNRLQPAGLPDAVQVFEGVDPDMPLKAWYAWIDLGSPDVDVRVLSSVDADGRESVSDFAEASRACLAVNGGYYRLDDDMASHIGLLMSGGRLVHDVTKGVYRDNRRYDVARAAIGFSASDEGSFGWPARMSDALVLLSEPFPNSPDRPAEPVIPDSLPLWTVTDAIAAGPAILREGLVRPATDEEVFFGSAIPDIHPRTAAGLTRDGDLILMVVDGRQSVSRGVDLAELGKLMLDVGAWQALNLDGGGSSTFVLDGSVLNRPAGGVFQREVASAVAVICNRKSAAGNSR